MNSNVQGNNITNEQQAMQLLQQVKFSGLTPLGTNLMNKVIQPLVLNPARSGQLQKPVVVITITDGTPAGENKDEIFNVILRTDHELRNSRYGSDAISYRKSSPQSAVRASLHHASGLKAEDCAAFSSTRVFAN